MNDHSSSTDDAGRDSVTSPVAAWSMLGGLVAILALTAWWIVRGDEAGGTGGRPPGGPNDVTSHVVEEQEFVATVETLGTVRAVETADISANVTETVEELSFDDGQSVEKGAVLARLSSAEEQAMLMGAKANLTEQRREVSRLEALVKDGAVPEIRLEERRTMLELARQRVAEAEAKLRDRTIRAPFSGVLGLRQISVGALVTPGVVITRLDQIDRVFVDFTVAEAYLADLAPGLELNARAAAYPAATFKAEVLAVDSRVDPVTRSVEVRAEIANNELKLRPGMLLTTRLQRDPRLGPSVPERAVTQSGQQAFVYVIRDGKEGSKTREVSRRSVELGRRSPGWVEILSGMEAGERIVADGVMGLSDEAEVNVTGSFAGPAEPFDPLEAD